MAKVTPDLTTYDIYFAPPNRDAPNLFKSEQAELAEQYSDLYCSGLKVAEGVGADGSVFENMQGLSQALEIVGMMSRSPKMIKGSRNYRAALRTIERNTISSLLTRRLQDG